MNVQVCSFEISKVDTSMSLGAYMEKKWEQTVHFKPFVNLFSNLILLFLSFSLSVGQHFFKGFNREQFTHWNSFPSKIDALIFKVVLCRLTSSFSLVSLSLSLSQTPFRIPMWTHTDTLNHSPLFSFLTLPWKRVWMSHRPPHPPNQPHHFHLPSCSSYQGQPEDHTEPPGQPGPHVAPDRWLDWWFYVSLVCRLRGDSNPSPSLSLLSVIQSH